MNRIFRLAALAVLTALALSAYGDNTTGRASSQVQQDVQQKGEPRGSQWGRDLDGPRHRRGLDKIKTVVIIYAENRGYDSLYGLFPGANGIRQLHKKKYAAQKDFDGSTLPVLPPTWGGMTAPGQSPVVTQAQTTGLPNKPFAIDNDFGLPTSVITRDLVHRFYNNQMQIDSGKNDKFAAYSDAGGLVMGHYDGSESDMALWKIAKKYVLADNFFMGAFGGSFLNHQYLICACAPQYPNADAPESPAKNSISAIDVDAEGNFVRLTLAATSPASVLDGPAVYLKDGTLTPADAKGMFYAVNTMQPPYQPSGNPPTSTDSTLMFSDPTKANTLPPQAQTNIGDLLSAKRVSWAWYAGSWNAALADGEQPAATTRAVIYTNPVQFQAHHHPFNYYAEFDPVAHASDRAQHLRDYTDFVAAAEAGTLPAVAFYKPQGNLNQHAGYADVAGGDAHLAEVIGALKQSPQWKHMLIILTYDENGGFWDHVRPPKGDRWGPGTRVPTIIVSPFAKRGYVDHTQYDTASILRFITRRFDLPSLPGLVERDRALAHSGYKRMGDLTNALELSR